MSAVKLVGRKTDFKGKTLWEIVGNLKNFGVGRIVARSMFERYPESSYMKIVKVEALPNEEVRKVKVTVEKVFRGRKFPKLVEIDSVSYKADYRLIPKDQEDIYCKIINKEKEMILPKTIDFPPLLKEFIIKETGNTNPKLNIRINSIDNKPYRFAKDNEEANVALSMGLGKPASPSLYEGLNI